MLIAVNLKALTSQIKLPKRNKRIYFDIGGFEISYKDGGKIKKALPRNPKYK